MMSLIVRFLILHYYLHYTVVEMCGGSMIDLSKLELMKRDDLQFEVVDESEYVGDDDDKDDLFRELSDLYFQDDDDDDDDEISFL